MEWNCVNFVGGISVLDNKFVILGSRDEMFFVG